MHNVGRAVVGGRRARVSAVEVYSDGASEPGLGVAGFGAVVWAVVALPTVLRRSSGWAPCGALLS